jgi:hypothetical protein
MTGPNTTPLPLDAAEKLKQLLPHCGFLFEIEDVIYSGTPKHRHPITQDEYLSLMADLYALVPLMRDVARVSADGQWRNCVTAQEASLGGDIVVVRQVDPDAVIAQVMEKTTDGTN